MNYPTKLHPVGHFHIVRHDARKYEHQVSVFMVDIVRGELTSLQHNSFDLPSHGPP